MSINGGESDVYSDLGEAWLQDQSARLKQRHLQFGRHYRMDPDALLARSAQVTRTARACAAASQKHDLDPDHTRRATIEAGSHYLRLEGFLDRMARSSSLAESNRQSTSTAKHPWGAQSVEHREFSRVDGRGTNSRDEWVAVLPDLAEVVVADIRGRPSTLGIAKAESIVENRAYLEARARQLLKASFKDNGDWRLIVIDFGVETERYDCEFLMCFAFQTVNGNLFATSPYVEIGFALHKQLRAAPIFVLTIRTATGFKAAPVIPSQDRPPS